MLITTLLAACGDGASDNNEIPISFDRQYDFDTYDGNQNAAQLTSDNPDYYIDLLFSNIVKDKSYLPGNNVSSNTSTTAQSIGVIQVNEFELCDNSGRITFSGILSDQGIGILDLDYQNCEIGGFIYDGKGAFEIHSVDLNTGFIQDSIFVFEKVLVTEPAVSFRLSGRIQYKEELSCNYDIITANLVLIDLTGSNHYKTSDLKISTNQNCQGLGKEEISGRIYHSTHGYVDISTVIPLRYSSATAIFPDREGVLQLAGANSSKARLSVNEITVFKLSTVNSKEYVNTFAIDVDGDDSYELRATMATSSFVLGGWKDISDSDGDGIPNSWESIYGLDQTDPADALFDNDGDSYSNYTEYVRYGIPTDSAILPVATDLSLIIHVPTTEVRAGREMNVALAIDNPNMTYGAQNIIVTLTKSSNASWTNISLCLVSLTNPDQINCNIDYIGQNQGRTLTIGLTSDNPDDVTLNSSVTTSTYDPILTNNNDSAKVTFAQRQTNLALEFDSIFGYHDVAVVGKSHTFDINVKQWGPDEARDTVFTMNLPDKVNVETVNYSLSSGVTGLCTISTEIRCDMGMIPFPGGVTIRVQFSGVAEMVSSYSASIFSSAIETDASDNNLISEVFVGQSIKIIQDQVDVAVAPATIVIPNGMFVGSIDYKGKDIRIESAQGPNNTVIWTASPFLPENDGTYPSVETHEYMKIGPNGSVSGIKFIAASKYTKRAIWLNGNNSLVENNIFEASNSYALNTRVIKVAGFGIEIRNNIFRNHNNSFSCALVESYIDSSFKVNNNIFHDNLNCTAIRSEDPYVSATDYVNQIISNNTFVNNDTAIELFLHNTASIQKIQNNIFANNNNGVGIRDSLTDTVLQAPGLNNNIFYNNASDYLNLDTENIIPFTGNLVADPQFIDFNNDNYHLQSTSIAIDAGEMIDSPDIDFDGVVRPQDGDLDGILNIDIGAYEYIP